MANPIAIAREQEIFVTVETTRGTLAPPTTTGLVVAAGEGSMNQKSSFTNSSEIQDTRSLLNRFQDRTGPGEWSFPVYASPVSKGVVPMEDQLMYCLFGARSIAAVTSVTYSLTKTKPSCSVWLKVGHTVFHAAGASVAKMTGALATKDGFKIPFSGQFMKMGWAGTCETSSISASAATDIEVVDAKKYTVGALVEFVESDVVLNNTDAGYTVTEVDVDTNTITITPGIEEEIDSGAIIRGWLPDATRTGTPLESRKGVASVDGTALAVRSMSIDINDSVEYLVDEITPSGYPEDFSEGERAVTGNVSFFFRQDDVKYFYDGQNNEERALKMTIGSTAGSILEVSTPRCSLDVPSISKAGNQQALDMPYVAMGTSGEDEVTAVYK